MKILFVSCARSGASSLYAYIHRTVQLEQHCKMLGASTSLIFLGDLFFYSPVLIQILNIPTILRYLKGFDVVIAEGNGSAYFLALAKPLLGTDTLVVYDMHSDVLTESRLIKKGRFDLAGYFIAFQMRLMEYVGFNGIDYFSAASQGLKQRLLGRNRRIRDEDVEVILNGVDLESFGSQGEILNDTCENGFTVTYAGSFPKYQGIENLIKAAEILRSEDVHFKFIGFGEDDLTIKKEILSSLGEKATLLDWLPKDELLAELRKSDILIIPADASSREQSENRVIVFPTKFAEFLALAKPVIVTRIDETSSIVEGFDCGFVCEPTAESIAETILKAKGTSKKVLHLKGSNGRRFAEAELDINSICRKYIQFLNRLIEKRHLQTK